MKKSVHEKILVLEPSCTKFAARFLSAFLFATKEIQGIGAEVPRLKKSQISIIESTPKRFYL
jgi:hypothetical protein